MIRSFFSSGSLLGIDEIKEYLPHRYPFLLIDKVLDYKEGEYILIQKNVTGNEDIFNGHFPKKAVYPGVLIVEGMAQSAAMLCYFTMGIKDPTLPILFMSLNDCKFRIPVTPGDTIIFKVTPINIKSKIAKVKGEAFVENKLVAEAVLTAMIDKNE